MSVALHYYAPRWIESTLKDITAFPAKPLSSIQWLLLAHSTTLIENQSINIHPAWKSLGSFCQEPWAAYCIRALCTTPHCTLSVSFDEHYCWMALFPCYHQIQLRQTRHYPIILSPTTHARWFECLSSLLPEPEWKIVSIGHSLLVGRHLPTPVDQILMSPGYFEHSSAWLTAKAELEMTLFMETQQGKDWEGMNSVMEYGSGGLSPGQTPGQWSTIEWTAWNSSDPLWILLGPLYGIPTVSDHDMLTTLEHHTLKKNIWIDLSLHSEEDSQKRLYQESMLWFSGKVSHITLHSILDTASTITLELPSSPWWQRRLYQWQIQHSTLRAEKQEHIKQSFLKKIGT